MELTYNELRKRDVINIVDGKCLGRITDMKFKFPQGVIQGIEVEGRKVCCLFRFFNKSNLYIPDTNIVKIGGDVILVDLKCGDSCAQNTTIGKTAKPQTSPCPPPCPSPCPPPGQPPCNPCLPPCPPPKNSKNSENCLDLSGIFDQNGKIDLDDY